MRDRIAAIIEDTIVMGYGGDIHNLPAIADAILSALPSMVKPLEWVANRTQHWSRCGVHKYGYWKVPTGKWYAVGSDESVFCDDEQGCIDWANNHNATTIMAAFGIEGGP